MIVENRGGVSMFKFFNKRLIVKATQKEDNNKIFYVGVSKRKNVTYELLDYFRAKEFRHEILFVWKRDIRIGLEKRFPAYNIEFIWD